MNLKIERLSLDGPAISRAYMEDDPSATSYYLAGSAQDPNSYARVAEWIRAESAPDRWQQLGENIRPTNEVTAQKLEEVVRRRGVFVSTGQQAGLFVSPLFTLYKALTAARLAEQLEERIGIPVLPLFSVASEDHDWAEVDHTYIVDLENHLIRLQAPAPELAAPEAPSPPVERVYLDGQIETVLNELSQLTPDTEFKSGILDPLRTAYRNGRPYAEAFQAMLAHLLRARPFLVTRTADSFVKQRSRELLWAEWVRREESIARLMRRADELSEAGFDVQVPVKPGTTNLFLDGPLGRDRIIWKGETAILRRAQQHLSGADLRRLLDETPEAVSPGALLRPVSEAHAFPVVAYVGGSSEVAYLAESQVLFDVHDTPAPVVVPRASFLLIEPKVERVLEKYGLAPGELEGDVNMAISRVLQDLTPPDVQASLKELRRELATGLQRVEQAAISFDPGAKSLVGSGKQAIYGAIGALESKLQGRVREKNEVAQQQIEKAAVNLYPDGKPQERVLSPLPYLIRYGEDFLESIYGRVVTPLG